jgi:hypothetical protein
MGGRIEGPAQDTALDLSYYTRRFLSVHIFETTCVILASRDAAAHDVLLSSINSTCSSGKKIQAGNLFPRLYFNTD